MPTFDNSYQVSLFVNNSSNAVVPGSPYLTSNQSMQASITKGGPVKNWKLLIAEGRDATTLLDGVRTRFIPVITNISHRHNDGRFWISSGSYHSACTSLRAACNSPIGSASDLTAYGRASTNFIGSYHRQTRHLQGLVTLGELGTTLRGIKSPLKSLRSGFDKLFSSYRKVIRGHRNYSFHKTSTGPDRMRAFADAITGTWLEWKFGITPTLSDADGAARALADLIESPDRAPHLRFIGNGEVISNDGTPQDLQLSFAGGWGDPQNRYMLKHQVSTSVRLRGGLRSDADGYPSMFDKLGLTLDEFVPTLWELIPFSFVVDYFVNTADVLNVWSHQTIRMSWVNRTTLRERKLHAKGPTSVAVYSNQRSSIGPFDTKALRREVFRISLDPASFLHIPELEFQIPGLGTQWLNMGALASQYGKLLSDVGKIRF